MFHFVQRGRPPRRLVKPQPDEVSIFKTGNAECWSTLTGLELFNSLQKEFKDHINAECAGRFDTGHLETLKQWLRCEIFPVVDSICLQNVEIRRLVEGEGDEDDLHDSDSDSSFDGRVFMEEEGPDSEIHQLRNKKEEFKEDIENLLLKAFGEAMSTDLFQMCIDYPDSQPVLLDLRYCLKVTKLRDLIVQSLKTDLVKRLLHTGVTTMNVVDAYVSVVRALKFLDPSGILLQLVTPPVREYLKQREETIRVILVSLTEESGELAEELARNPSDSTAQSASNDSNWQTWVPDPVDIPRDKHNLREADLIQTFVSIYGSKSLFIEEYRTLLADRLLKMPKPITSTREVKCLELLKLRFGESDLQKCEVMLKDVADSQRMNTRFAHEHFKFLESVGFDFTTLTISAQFWPHLKFEDLKLPKEVEDGMTHYTATFEAIKGNRSLEFIKQIGTVELEVEYLGTTATYCCTPVHAVILMQFQQKARWTLKDLAAVTKVSVASLRSRIRFWMTRGILIAKGDTYSLLEKNFGSKRLKSLTGPGGNGKYMDDDEMESPMTSTTAIREKELQMFWSYIEGMLTNLGTLPLTRIHSMLKLFATVECSSEELQKFLDAKVSKGILVYSAGQYQLQK